MDYSIELLRVERDRLKEDFDKATSQEPKDWDVICRNERLINELNRAIDLLWINQYEHDNN